MPTLTKPFKVVLAGNPNAGKTTLFNSLTKSNLRTGNFHGVTTSSFEKQAGDITFIDSPGLYSLSPYTLEEANATNAIINADLIINVIDCLTLENSLNLTKKLIALKKPIIVYVTKTNLLKRRGGSIDIEKLSEFLGVPVYDKSCKNLKKIISGDVKKAERDKSLTLTSAYNAGKSQSGFLDKLFYNRFFSLFFFIFSIILMFFLTFHPQMIGAYLKDLLNALIQNTLGSLLLKMQNEGVKSFFNEVVILGAGGVFCFIPQLCVLYLFLTLLDESGITSSLTFATDGLFEKVNLSGRAAFSLISGFGCTASAILTSGGYSTKSAQKRTIAILPYIPCGAKLPVFLTFLSPLFKNPFPIITCFYFSGLTLSILFSYLLKGESENMLSEVTPIIFPSVNTVFKKLCFYLKGFIIKVGVTVTLFCIVNWVLSHFSFSFEYVKENDSMLAYVCKIITPIFYPMGINEWQLAYASLCGFIAKENIAATISMLMPAGANLSTSSALAMCAFVLLCPACISAFSSSCKEVGWKFTLKYFCIQLVFAFLGAYSVNLIMNAELLFLCTR